MYVAAGQAPPATPEKVLLRVFVHFHGQRVILLLHGYDKGADDSPRHQQREIAVARKRLGAWKRAEAARSRRRRRIGVDTYVFSHILYLSGEGRLEMPKTFAECTAERDATLTAEGATAVRVFEAAYAFGAALAGARRARHLTQTELASSLRITQADISCIEHGQLTPTTPTLLKLIEAMHGQLAVIVPTGDSGGELSDRGQLVALSLV